MFASPTSWIPAALQLCELRRFTGKLHLNECLSKLTADLCLLKLHGNASHQPQQRRWRRILDCDEGKTGQIFYLHVGEQPVQTPAASRPSLDLYARQFGVGSRLKKSNQKGEAGGKEAAQSRSPGSLMIRLLTA